MAEEKSNDIRCMSKRYDQALVFASAVHRNQCRKGSDVPYISHLLCVSSMVLEHGGGEDQAIAALLHDAPEDQGGSAMLDTITRKFGKTIARLVEECTEPLRSEQTDWVSRKQAYLDHL